MPFRNRGIVKPPRKFAGAKAPRPPRPPSLQHKAPGAPPTPRSAEVDEAALAPPIPPPPRDWFGPATEWVVWYWLTARKGYVPNRDFLYQVAIGTQLAPGGPTNSKGFVRADFWLLPQGKHGPLGWPFPGGLIINPISAFTHPSIGKDHLERGVFATLGYLEVFIDEADLVGPTARPADVIPLALAGTDISTHK